MNILNYPKNVEMNLIVENREYVNYSAKKLILFCNSHNIPSKILQNIAYDNQLVSFFKGSDTGEKEDYGYKNAGIFKCICRECDGNLFQLYENRTEDDNRVKGYNQEMMNLIALKCNLFLYCEYTEGYRDIEIYLQCYGKLLQSS